MNTKLREASLAQLSAITENYYAFFDYDNDCFCIDIKDEQSLEAGYALLAATQAVIDAQTEVCPDCFGEKYIYSSETDLRETSSCPTCKGRGRMIKERT